MRLTCLTTVHTPGTTTISASVQSVSKLTLSHDGWRKRDKADSAGITEDKEMAEYVDNEIAEAFEEKELADVNTVSTTYPAMHDAMVAVDNLSQAQFSGYTKPVQRPGLHGHDPAAGPEIKGKTQTLCKTCGSSNSVPEMGERESQSLRNVTGNPVK